MPGVTFNSAPAQRSRIPPSLALLTQPSPSHWLCLSPPPCWCRGPERPADAPLQKPALGGWASRHTRAGGSGDRTAPSDPGPAYAASSSPHWQANPKRGFHPESRHADGGAAWIPLDLVTRQGTAVHLSQSSRVSAPTAPSQTQLPPRHCRAAGLPTRTRTVSPACGPHSARGLHTKSGKQVFGFNCPD